MELSQPVYKKNACHIFEADGNIIWFGIYDLRVVILSKEERYLLTLCDGKSEEEIVDACHKGLAPVDALKALEQLVEKGIVSNHLQAMQMRQPEGSELIHLNLDIVYDCNFSCTYCYLRETLQQSPVYMTEEVGRRAVNFLLKEMGCQKRGYISFCGGEPLMNSQLLRRVVDYTNQRALATGKEIHFELTTNGTFLRRDTIQALSHRNVFINLSMDGNAQVHNAFRVKENQSETYALTAEAVRALESVSASEFGFRAVVTKQDLDLVGRISHLRKQAPSTRHIYIEYAMLTNDDPNAITTEDLEAAKYGLVELKEYVQEQTALGACPWIGWFEDLILQIANRIPNAFACNAGGRSLTVSPDGSFYLCPGLVEKAEFKVGNVYQGIEREKITRFYGSYAGFDGTQWMQLLAGNGCANEEYLEGKTKDEDSISTTLMQFMYEQAIAAYVYFLKNQPELLKTRYGQSDLGPDSGGGEHTCRLARTHYAARAR